VVKDLAGRHVLRSKSAIPHSMIAIGSVAVEKESGNIARIEFMGTDNTGAICSPRSSLQREPIRINNFRTARLQDAEKVCARRDQSAPFSPYEPQSRPSHASGQLRRNQTVLSDRSFRLGTPNAHYRHVAGSDEDRGSQALSYCWAGEIGVLRDRLASIRNATPINNNVEGSPTLATI